MPEIFYKNGISYIKKHKRRSLFFGFLFLVILCFLIINISDIISSIITNSRSIFVKNKIEIPSYSGYAVAVETDNENIKNISKIIENLGGAGIDYEKENCSLISMYPTLLQAKEIQNNLVMLGNQVQIVTFCINGISKKYTAKGINDIITSIKYYKTIYKQLFNLSVNFDKELLSIQQVKNSVKDILKLLINYNLETKNKCNNYDYKNILNIFYNEEKDNLYQLINFNSAVNLNKNKILDTNLQFSSLIKQVYFKTIFLNIDLVNKINYLN